MGVLVGGIQQEGNFTWGQWLMWQLVGGLAGGEMGGAEEEWSEGDPPGPRAAPRLAEREHRQTQELIS